MGKPKASHSAEFYFICLVSIKSQTSDMEMILKHLNPKHIKLETLDVTDQVFLLENCVPIRGEQAKRMVSSL